MVFYKGTILVNDVTFFFWDSDNLKIMLKYLLEHTQQTLMTSITNTAFSNIKELQMFHVEQKEGISYVR